MNKLIFTAILSGFAGLYAMGQNEIRLMDMDLNKSYQTYGGAVKGKSVTNEPASIQGKTYDDVIGVQAKSHIKIDLHKNASRFKHRSGSPTHISIIQIKASRLSLLLTERKCISIPEKRQDICWSRR